jgi:type I restriction enzyme R subunit
LNHLLAHPPGGKAWRTPQRDWLTKIAAQTKANTLDASSGCLCAKPAA